MFQLFLLIYLAYRNGVRAKLKGLNNWLWGIVTAITFLSTFTIGFMIVVFNFCADYIDIDSFASPDPKVRSAVTMQLVELINNNPLHVFTIELFGIGGYLLIRYILEKKPDKKEPEIHWMDKLGENR